jgi:hypothetical protein
VVSFPQVFSPKLCTRISPSPYALQAPPLSLLDFITHKIVGEKYK